MDKNWNVRFTAVPLKDFSDQVWLIDIHVLVEFCFLNLETESKITGMKMREIKILQFNILNLRTIMK